MNRGELETLAANYMHRNDLTSDMPGFVDFATKRLGRMLRSQANEAAFEFSANSNPYPLPADYRGMRAVTSAQDRGPKVLASVSPQQINRLQSIGVPAVYSVSAKLITFAPYQASTITINYWQEPEAMALATDTNAVLEQYPYLYLYATLVEASIFVDDTEKAASMMDVLVGEVDQVNSMSRDANAGDLPTMGAT
jgi:hypothetical protein